MSKLSHFADVWTSGMIGCDGWPITPVDPPMRWDQHPSHRQKPINTSFPVLFVSNSHDPVTPLRAGVKMAQKFVNAGLIEQGSEGHCSIAAGSLCTIGKMRAYMREGKVPPPPKLGKDGDIRKGEWDRCEADEWPWHGIRGADPVRMDGFGALPRPRPEQTKKYRAYASTIKRDGTVYTTEELDVLAAWRKLQSEFTRNFAGDHVEPRSRMQLVGGPWGTMYMPRIAVGVDSLEMLKWTTESKVAQQLFHAQARYRKKVYEEEGIIID
jgi:hypothetical protein